MAECESLMRELLKHGPVLVVNPEGEHKEVRGLVADLNNSDLPAGVLVGPSYIWTWDYIRDVRPGPGNTYYSRSIKCELGYN